MKHNLDEARAIIEDLQQAIEEKKLVRDEIKKLNPDWEQLSDENWIQQESRCWLHGATEVLESTELEKWLFDNPPLSNTANEKAEKIIKYWKAWLKQTNKYHRIFGNGYFAKVKLEKPVKNETLREYFIRTATTLETKGKGTRLEWRAFKNLLEYMRNIDPQEIAFIEQIFPKKMDVYFGKIIRKIAPEVYPISQEVARDILCELTQMAIKGRPDSRLSALESLGLFWLCLTASRLRLPTYLELVERTKVSAICINGPYPTMLVPTLFGEREIRISDRVARFFIALSKIPSKEPRETILQSPKRSLTRAFDRALRNCEINPDYGNITYVTMLSTPHHFGRDLRYTPK